MDYKKVPNIITGKDLDYIQDVFNWNFINYKNTINAMEMVENSALRKVFEKAANLFYSSMEEILNILQEGLNENSK